MHGAEGLARANRGRALEWVLRLPPIFDTIDNERLSRKQKRNGDNL